MKHEDYSDKVRNYYLKYYGQRCPFCKMDSIETMGSLESSYNTVTQDVKCNKCGREWRDIYRLLDIEPIEV